MKIVFAIDDLLVKLFPAIENQIDRDYLINFFTDFYTINSVKPNVYIEQDLVIVEINANRMTALEKEFNRATSLCDRRQYDKAKPILESLISKDQTNSEYYRVYGQILAEEGNIEEAINYMIDSLRWNPRNTYALIMTGNIFSRNKNDIDTALIYFNKAVEIDPKEFIALNNIGATLLELHRIDEAQTFFEKAYEVEPNYPNTSFGLAYCYLNKQELLKSFNFCIAALKHSKPNEQIYNASQSLIGNISDIYIKSYNGFKIIDKYKKLLEERCQKEVIIQEDNNLPAPAKIEIAENYNRNYHLLKYENRPGIEHLIMHELRHLDLILQARENNTNQIFYSTPENKEAFMRENERFINELGAKGLRDNDISQVISKLFNGLNMQIFNTPIDLFIEQFLFDSFPELSPFQFVSLTVLLNEYKRATNDKNIQNTFPYSLREINGTLLLVNVYQYKDLYGIDSIKDFKVSNYQKKESLDLYRDYLSYEHKPGLEYKIIDKWANKLKVRHYFELSDENEYGNKEKTIEEVTRDIQEDPLNLRPQADETGETLKMNNPAGNMAIVMYCLSALELFEGKSQDYIREVGFEIAMLGRYGLDPKNSEQKYNLKSVPEKKFTALQLLTYMFVAFQSLDPNLETGLDFKNEYEMALQIFRQENE